MATTWVLMLVLISSADLEPHGLTSVPGFKSELECQRPQIKPQSLLRLRVGPAHEFWVVHSRSAKVNDMKKRPQSAEVFMLARRVIERFHPQFQFSAR